MIVLHIAGEPKSELKNDLSLFQNRKRKTSIAIQNFSSNINSG